MVKKRVTEQKQEVIEILHVDAFNTWLLLDYTRFTVARLRDIEPYLSVLRFNFEDDQTASLLAFRSGQADRFPAYRTLSATLACSQQPSPGCLRCPDYLPER